jgi:hypothetical protein
VSWPDTPEELLPAHAAPASKPAVAANINRSSVLMVTFPAPNAGATLAI